MKIEQQDDTQTEMALLKARIAELEAKLVASLKARIAELEAKLAARQVRLRPKSALRRSTQRSTGWVPTPANRRILESCARANRIGVRLVQGGRPESNRRRY